MNYARIKNHEQLCLRRKRRVDKTLKLVKDILKKKGRRDITGRLSEHNLLGVYQISKFVEVLTPMDHTFLSRSFPWILYENTHFCVAWDYIVFAIGVAVIVTYPYFLFYLSTPPPVYYQFLRPLAYTAFAIDVIIQLCTSTVDEHQQLISTFSEIMTYRCSELMFLIDVLSITPFELVSLMTGAALAEHAAYIGCNHMLKVFRVFSKLVDITNSLHVKGKAIRIVFYVICLLYFGCLQGIIFFKTACPKRPCENETWMSIHLDYVSKYNVGLRDSVSYVLLVAVYDGVMFLTGTAGVLTSRSVREQAVLACFCLSYMYLFTYLLADYSATLNLDGYLQNQFRIEVSNLSKFMHVANMNKTTIFRMETYMETIYKLSNGKVMPTVFDDAPWSFKERMRMEKIQPHISKLPLFQKFSRIAMRRLLSKVKYDIYPPNEYVAYVGDRSHNMYVIQKGYCEISTSGLRITKLIGPGDNAGVYEMSLMLPLLHNIKTVTNVKLFYLNVKDFNDCFRVDETLLEIFQSVIEPIRNTTVVDRTFNIDQKEFYQQPVKTRLKSFINFKAGKLDVKTIDLHNGWRGYSMISFLMMKKTIRPDSRFIYIYVMFHAMVAFLSAILYPSMFILECIMSWYAILLLTLPWDLLCLIDVYLRLHMCYYNKRGMLVSHPRCTAANYLKHSFAVDFCTALPLKLVFDYAASKKVGACVLFVKLIRAYRIPNGFAYWRRDVLKNPPTYLLILNYLTMSLVFWHAMTLGLVVISVDLGADKNGQATIRPMNASWFYTKANSEITFDQGEYAAPLKLYVLALYCITSFSLQINLADVIMIRRIELLYIILTIISGYIWFTYILVIIANTKAVYNDNLTKYKNNLKDLCTFMRTESIPKTVKRRNIRHFEYIYQRNQGYRDEGIFDEFHPTLRKDCQWEIYSATMLCMPTFKDMDLAFYQRLCAEIRIVYYLENNNILCVNDVINWVYIIARGGVEVSGATGVRVCVLAQGAIFGNLDNVEYTRCLLRYRTITTADILCIPSVQFYKILADYPMAISALKNDMFNNNFCYVESQEPVNIAHTSTPILSKWKRFLMSTWIKFIFMVLSYISYQLALYHAAFQRHTITLYVVLYFLDAVHIIKIYVIFRTPYINEMGELIISKELLRKRGLKKPSFYIDLLAVIPIEVLALACPLSILSVHTYISIFRLNRVLRFLNISIYIRVTHDHLHVNAIIIRMVSLFIYSTTYLHILACVWYVCACPNGACATGSWIYDGVTNLSNCRTGYLCALYYVTSLVSSAGFSTFIPRRIIEIHLTIVTIVLSKFVTTMLVANMAALVRHFGYRLQLFTERVNVMRTYFKNSQISPHLQHNVLKYIERLWLRSAGKQMPDFLQTGPTLLIEEMKIFAFGGHIFGNPVFRDCHNDFLRLLTTHAKLVRHFMGDVICNQGEINDTMYFVHWGQVEVLCISERVEVQVDLLTQLDCFGMIQGLFPNTPHSHMYKAAGTVEIVTLRLADWMQILVFYPAARFHIYRTIRDYRGLFAYIRNLPNKD